MLEYTQHFGNCSSEPRLDGSSKQEQNKAFCTEFGKPASLNTSRKQSSSRSQGTAQSSLLVFALLWFHLQLIFLSIKPLSSNLCSANELNEISKHTTFVISKKSMPNISVLYEQKIISFINLFEISQRTLLQRYDYLINFA